MRQLLETIYVYIYIYVHTIDRDFESSRNIERCENFNGTGAEGGRDGRGLLCGVKLIDVLADRDRWIDRKHGVSRLKITFQMFRAWREEENDAFGPNRSRPPDHDDYSVQTCHVYATNRGGRA